MGLLMGCIPWLRLMLDPYIEFFRFIPPIAFVTLAIIWLGPGEASKVALIFYTTVFIVTLNTIAGVLSVNESGCARPGRSAPAPYAASSRSCCRRRCRTWSPGPGWRWATRS